MNLTLALAIVLIAAGVLALLIGMALEGTMRSREPHQRQRRKGKPK